MGGAQIAPSAATKEGNNDKAFASGVLSMFACNIFCLCAQLWPLSCPSAMQATRYEAHNGWHLATSAASGQAHLHAIPPIIFVTIYCLDASLVLLHLCC